MHTRRSLALAALLLTLTACSGEGGSVEKYMDSAGDVESLAISDFYDAAVSDVVIVCPYDTPSAALDELGFAGSDASSSELDETQQAVIAVREKNVVESEVMSRKVLDLCGDADADYRPILGANTTLKVTSEEWSDGTMGRVAKLE